MSFYVSLPEFAATGERVAALNKRAAKAGIPATAKLVEIDRREVTERNEFGIERKYVVIEAEITGLEDVKLGDWTIAATLDHDAAGNIFRTNPAFGLEIPVEFRGTDATRCDHCHTRRNRNQTVLVWNEAEGFKQVGSDCVKLFLGVSPASLIAWFRDLDELTDDEFLGGWGRNEVNVKEFVAVAALVTETYGFVPKSFYDKTPTASIVNHFLNPSKDFAKAWPELAALRREVRKGEAVDPIIARANALAEAALAWIAAETSDSDYIVNLRLAAAREAVGRNEGLLASLPNAYKKAAAKAAEAAAKEALPASGHVGSVGEKVTANAKVIYTNRSEGYAWNSPDSLFVILLASDGTKFYANTTVETAFGRLAEDADKETEFKVTGTVKAHKVTDKGDKVTVLTRVKMEDVK